MTQSQFMYDLMLELEGIPDEEKFVLMNDYNQFFENKLEEGMTEEEIVNNLRTPHDIARSYKKGKPIPIEGVDSVLTSEQTGKKTLSSVFKFVLLIPVCAVYEVLAAALCAAVMLTVLALCLACAIGGVVSFVSVSLGGGFVLLGIGAVFLTFAFVVLFMLSVRLTADAVKLFPRFMGRVLANKPAERRNSKR